ncbi:MAG: hypothetical protein B7Z55_00080 [Planctomycetales bacterium 12-60-4]|nr:MAG: hypothetical protein B7Z55_00080 [Planctomycetales bacterium 12-60-4]
MSRNIVLVLPFVAAVLFVFTAWGPAAPPNSDPDQPLELQMPDSLRARHEAFHAEFVQATQEDGKVGDAARMIETLGTTHFAKAKDAFAPLGLLPQLAEHKLTPAMRDAIQKAEKLRAGLPKTHGEHRQLLAGLNRLAEAAQEEGKMGYVRFAERLTLHIQEEEELLYPAVLVVGDYVKLRLNNQ